MTTEERANWQAERISQLTEELKRERVVKAQLLLALKEVVRISDRKHDVWDYAKDAIAVAEGRKPK